MKLELVIYPDKDYLFNGTWICKTLTNNLRYNIEPINDYNYLKIYWR